MVTRSELWKAGASELAATIRSKQVSSREVVQAHLDRIAAVNPAVNAVTVVLAESALAAADDADARIAGGGALGLLCGVPMTVKENVDLTGSATTQGVVAMAEAFPSLDAPHVAQLKAAGAIPIGRTNLPDFGLRWHSDNALRGATRNPWDASRTPGGSSGGEAVALATGMTPLGLGNDYGGSLRLPSQFNGTAALKPTLGRVPSATALAPQEAPLTFQLFAVQGPMARSVRDLRLALECMSGPDPRDPWWTPAPLRGPAPQSALRVAVTADPAGLGVDPDVAAGIRRAADALRDAGYTVEEVEPPSVAEAATLWAALAFADIQAAFLPIMRQLASPDAIRFLDTMMQTRPEPAFAEYAQGLAQRNAIARAWAQFQAERPLILGPVSTQQPFPVGQDVASADEALSIQRSLRLTVAVNLLGLPAVAVPVGVANGLPQGVQLIGPRYREDLCLEAAQEIENRLGSLTPIDPR